MNELRCLLHSTEMSTSLVAVRQELEDARAIANAARVAEEAGRQQLARMMDEQLAQTQTIEALRRQVETSNNAARDAQALLRATQEQQQQYSRTATQEQHATAQQFTNLSRRKHWQHSLHSACISSIDRDAYKRVAWPGILSCGITRGPWIC